MKSPLHIYSTNDESLGCLIYIPSDNTGISTAENVYARLRANFGLSVPTPAIETKGTLATLCFGKYSTNDLRDEFIRQSESVSVITSGENHTLVMTFPESSFVPDKWTSVLKPYSGVFSMNTDKGPVLGCDLTHLSTDYHIDTKMLFTYRPIKHTYGPEWVCGDLVRYQLGDCVPQGVQAIFNEPTTMLLYRKDCPLAVRHRVTPVKIDLLVEKNLFNKHAQALLCWIKQLIDPHEASTINTLKCALVLYTGILDEVWIREVPSVEHSTGPKTLGIEYVTISLQGLLVKSD